VRRGAPDNKPWDPVLIAAEERSGIQGEIFELLESVLARGSAVILETWYLDEIKEGAVKPILMRCGVGAAHTGTADARIVVGARPEEPDSYGGQLIIQSFSMHNDLDETMVPL